MPWPNFFIIGAQKAATSSLHGYLAQHPDVFMSAVKEPAFFCFDGTPSSAARLRRRPPPGPLRWLWRPYRLDMTLESESYLSLFRGVTDERAIGESTTAYLYTPGTAERIRRAVPQARLIAVLRHPVDRAYSQFLHNRRTDHEPLARFEDAVAAEAERAERGAVGHWRYLWRSRYAEQLSRYLAVFPRDQVCICLYDDLVADPRALLRTLFDFLGVDDTFEADLSVRRNRATALPEHQRSRLFELLLNRPNRLKSLVKRLIPSAVVRYRVRRLLHAVNRRSSAPPRPPPLAAATRARMTEAMRGEIERLQDLLQRDLSHWLAGPDSPA